MGSEVNATCKCGLETTILIGRGDGVDSAMACYFPCVCRGCEDVVRLNQESGSGESQDSGA